MSIPGNESNSALAYSSMYFVSNDTETSLTRLNETTTKIGVEIDDKSLVIYRSFMRFSMPRLPRNSVISSASLNIKFSNSNILFSQEPADFEIWEYPPSAQSLTYNLSYWSCINGLISENCDPEYTWDGGTWCPSGAFGTTSNMGNSQVLFLPPEPMNTIKSIYITDLVEYYNINRSTLGLTLELMIKQNEESPNVIREIYSANIDVLNPNMYIPVITYSHNLPVISLVSTTATQNIFNGEILSNRNIYDNIIFNAIPVSGSRSLSEPTFLNGMPIMTSNYGNHRAIHIYEIADIGSTNEMRTTWNGIPIQLVSYGNADDYVLLIDIEDEEYSPNNNDINKTFLIGNLHINLDNEYRLLIHEKTGTPIETHYVFIGGNPVRIGRFADGWAIGISY